MATNLEAFKASLESVTLGQIQPARIERRPGRKVLAAEARKVLRSLGIRGVSVTAPNYSMAQSVSVAIPHFEELNDENRWPERAALRTKVEAILFAAFPNHRDRSESGTDYYDYCWSVQ